MRVAFGTGIVRGVRFAELEFEWAAPPRARAFAASRDAYAPAAASSAENGLGVPFFVASGSGSAFAGFAATRAYADADDMDLGGAWWHGGGAARLAAPLALAGADFRDWIHVRFSVAAAEASVSVASLGSAHERSVVAAWFVSSALVLVEPPALPPRVADEHEDVLVDVSVDGGATFSETKAFLRAARALSLIHI